MRHTEATTVRQLAVVYGIAAGSWLGLSTWGLLSDCLPGQFDGQCGMSTFFGGACGAAAAFIVIGIGRALGMPRHFSSRRQRPALLGAMIAFLASIAVLNLQFIFNSGARASQSAAEAAALWPVASFVSAPFAFAIVVAVVTGCVWRLHSTGRVTVRWAGAVGTLSGLLIGLLTPERFEFGMFDRFWMLSSGLLMGISAGVLFGWLGLRNQSELAAR